MDLTIDELARRVAMSARNIREWQRQGLINPPERRGRVGIYSEQHIARIERVKQLHARGLPLDLIKRVSATGTGSDGDLRHLADEVLTPVAAPNAGTLPRSEIVARVGERACTALAQIGLIVATNDDPDTVAVRDTAVLEQIEQLAHLGISPETLTTALIDVQRHQHDIARLVIEAYRTDVWKPFLDSRFTAGDWGSLADGVTRAKPITIDLLARLLDVALDDVVGEVLVAAASDTERTLDQG